MVSLWLHRVIARGHPAMCPGFAGNSLMEPVTTSSLKECGLKEHLLLFLSGFVATPGDKFS